MLAAVACASARPAPPSPMVLAPSATVAPSCPAPGTGSDILPSDLSPVDSVTTYLNQGGDPPQLTLLLSDRQWLAPNSGTVLTDLDGDARPDFAAGLVGPPDSRGIALEGAVVVWFCRQGTYEPTAVLPSVPPSGLPAVEGASDLTGNGRTDLVAFLPTCGAHTCVAQYHVYEWDGTALVDRFSGASDDLPSPEWIVHPAGPGEPSTIEIVAHGINSVGAGPYRERTRTWTWDSSQQAFAPSGERLEPPRFRIHAVHDADDAFAEGDFAASLALDERVIADTSLLDWTANSGGPSDLAGYAAYRRVLTELASGSPEAARAEFAARFGPTGDTSAYRQLADVLITSASEGLGTACARVRELVAADPDRFLSPLDYGYANRSYQVEDLCPTP
jgi:hypothetical protein